MSRISRAVILSVVAVREADGNAVEGSLQLDLIIDFSGSFHFVLDSIGKIPCLADAASGIRDPSTSHQRS